MSVITRTWEAIKDKTASSTARTFLSLLDMWSHLMNRNPHLPYYRQKYQGGKYNQIVRIQLPDMRVGRTFWVNPQTNKVVTLVDDAQPTVIAKLDKLTLLEILLQWHECPAGPDGRVWYEPYSPLLAYQDGSLTLDSPNGVERGYLSDMWVFFGPLWKEVANEFLAIIEPTMPERVATIRELNTQQEAMQKGIWRESPYVILPERQR